MERGDAVYEFIDKFAYFSCAANIVLENYTMTDGEDAYKKLMIAFDRYIEYYNKLMEGVEQGIFTMQVAEVSLKTYVNWLQNKSMQSFTEKLKNCLVDQNEVRINFQDQMQDIQKKIRTSKFTTLDLQELLEYIRDVEEKDRE